MINIQTKHITLYSFYVAEVGRLLGVRGCLRNTLTQLITALKLTIGWTRTSRRPTSSSSRGCTSSRAADRDTAGKFRRPVKYTNPRSISNSCRSTTCTKFFRNPLSWVSILSVLLCSVVKCFYFWSCVNCWFIWSDTWSNRESNCKWKVESFFCDWP